MKLKLFLILFLLLCASLFTRLQFTQPTMWDGDTARDIMVATHISKYKEFPSVGYAASALNYYHPPYFFYLLSFLSKMTTNYMTLVRIFSVVHALSVFTVYFIGKQLYNVKTGLIAATFYVFSTSMVFMSGNVWNPHAVVPFFLLSVLFFTIYLKGGARVWLYASIASLIFLSTLHYAVFPFIILLLIVSFVTKRFSFKSALLLLFITVCFFSILLTPLIIHFGIVHTVSKFVSILKPISLSTISPKIQTSFVKLFEIAYFYKHERITFSLILLTPLLIISIIKNKSNTKLILQLFTVIIFHPIISSLKSGEVYGQHFTTLIPLLYIFYALIIYLANKAFKHIVFKAGVFFISILLILAVAVDMPKIGKDRQEYEISHTIANVILSDYEHNHKVNNPNYLANFQVITITAKSFDWHSPAVLYFLEEKTGRKLVSVNNKGNNLSQINPPIIIYVVCSPYQGNVSIDECQRKLQFIYPAIRKQYRLPGVYEDYYLIKYLNT